MTAPRSAEWIAARNAFKLKWDLVLEEGLENDYLYDDYNGTYVNDSDVVVVSSTRIEAQNTSKAKHE
ncbi:hypothetical protein D4765_11740 [Subtercola vilae]|uniref:Uncharacterized protein n=1 Tax=Subtercola vilae TaxID=2056433 RepID=A0A4T2BV04_9MICO|nr:hypothetical protein D4765_11740 [Subtercola vilae]